MVILNPANLAMKINFHTNFKDVELASWVKVVAVQAHGLTQLKIRFPIPTWEKGRINALHCPLTSIHRPCPSFIHSNMFLKVRMYVCVCVLKNRWSQHNKAGKEDNSFEDKSNTFTIRLVTLFPNPLSSVPPSFHKNLPKNNARQHRGAGEMVLFEEQCGHEKKG